MHPLASHVAAQSGAFELKAGDHIITPDGRRGVADEFLQDGDALVSWDDGTFGVVRWNHIRPDIDQP